MPILRGFPAIYHAQTFDLQLKRDWGNTSYPCTVTEARKIAEKNPNYVWVSVAHTPLRSKLEGTFSYRNLKGFSERVVWPKSVPEEERIKQEEDLADLLEDVEMALKENPEAIAVVLEAGEVIDVRYPEGYDPYAGVEI